MAFDTITAIAAVNIIDISVELFDPDPLGDESLRVKSGDLVPHITAMQISVLQAFTSTLRTQAENEILP